MNKTIKKLFENWNLYELVWLVVFSTIAIALTIMWKDSFFGFSVFLTGILCVIFAAKGNIWTYIFGMYNTFGYAYTAFNNRLFGEMGLNLFFFVPMNIIGFLMWKKNMGKDNNVKMLSMGRKSLIKIVVVCIAGIAGLGFILSLIPSQNTPYIDATTNVLSIMATFLMVKRFKEQWILYIILNVFTVIMWIIRTVNGSSDGALMIVMWSAYLINATYGYYNWNKGSREGKI